VKAETIAARKPLNKREALPMSAQQEANGTIDPVMKPFFDMWSVYFKQANDAQREFFQGIDNTTNLKALQRRWNDAVGKSADAFMRSPAFLQAMKQNADAVIKLKQQTDDLSKEFARNANIPTTSDISGLFERLHSVEEVILSRLGRIEERLRAIEENVGMGQEVDVK
jgi:hypothetical protein